MQEWYSQEREQINYYDRCEKNVDKLMVGSNSAVASILIIQLSACFPPGFKTMRYKAMRCIQFNDSGTIYSLKVVHGTGVVFEVELDEGQPKMERKTPHMYIFEIYWLTCRASNKKTLHSVVLPLS